MCVPSPKNSLEKLNLGEFEYHRGCTSVEEPPMACAAELSARVAKTKEERSINRVDIIDHWFEGGVSSRH